MDFSNLILELYDRVNKLEKEVAELKRRISETERPPVTQSPVFVNSFVNKEQLISPAEQEVKPRERNKDKFLFNGNKLLKNQFVLSVIKEYVLTHPAVTREELKKNFPKKSARFFRCGGRFGRGTKKVRLQTKIFYRRKRHYKFDRRKNVRLQSMGSIEYRQIYRKSRIVRFCYRNNIKGDLKNEI